MLIDAGENSDGTIVVDYLKAQGVDKLDYIIGTHPHSDHIGGMDTVIDYFEVGEVIMPDVEYQTKTYDEVLDAIERKNINITYVDVGDDFQLGDAEFTIIAPNSEAYKELNNYSIGIKLVNGNTSFIMAGDAEKLSENEMCSNDIDIDVDVLKLGHHGSRSSTSDKYLDEVTPDYAVISVGEDNRYGHPHEELLKRLSDAGSKTFITYDTGAVTIHTDGASLEIEEYLTNGDR